jgi:hypothetical protein
MVFIDLGFGARYLPANFVALWRPSNRFGVSISLFCRLKALIIQSVYHYFLRYREIKSR